MKFFKKDYRITLTYHFNKGGVFCKTYEVENATDDTDAILATKEEFYSEITDGYKNKLPDGKLEIYCIRK